MYRKQVRRRRAVLVLLVIVSLILLSTHFSEGSDGPLHSIERGFAAVLAPVEEGADRALKPGRDLVAWFDETFKARGENDDLNAEVEDLRGRLAAAESATKENDQLRKLLKLGPGGGIAGYEAVTARVIGRSPTVWYATVTVDRGSSSGVRVDDPVITGDGLVGRVTDTTAGTAQVTLITDHRSAVSATTVPSGPSGRHQARGRGPRESVARLHPERPRGPGGRDGRHGRVDERSPQLSVPVRDPDRPRDRGDRQRAGDLPARSRRAVRRHARPRLRPGADGRPRRGPGVDRSGGRRLIVTPRIVLRIALVILAGVILQLTFFSQITILGASPNILPVLAVCLGLLGGAVVGAVCGFAIGFLIDSALLQTLGVSSLALLTVGYLAGRYREGFDVTNPLVPPAARRRADAARHGRLRGRPADARESTRR